nr:hypothetical protein LTR18_002310 [Exophiala xenobiotica]
MIRIRDSRRWWCLPYREISDLPESLQELVSIYERTEEKQIIETASKEGLVIVRDGLSILWIEDHIFTTRENMAALVTVPKPKSELPLADQVGDQGVPGNPSTKDADDDTPIERTPTPQVGDETQNETCKNTETGPPLVPRKSEKPPSGALIDVETLRQQPELKTRTSDQANIILKEGSTCVLGPDQGIEVRAGGIPSLTIRYRVVSKKGKEE